MDEDVEDFVCYGTPIEREEETSARKRKAAADAGQLRSLPAWKQEVRDDEGRRRFHGAFTGGFSAGYYNTVGSKEGWTPQTFTSSRKNRAEVKKQSIYNFLDDEDLKGMGGHTLETSMQFDTFGFTAAEAARKQAEKDQQKRPSAIPGPVPDEIVLPEANSIGVKLLLKMGWRRGHSIKDTNSKSLYDARREARKAFLAFSGSVGGSELYESDLTRSESEDLNERFNHGDYGSQSTPVYVLNPKQDLYGLGYDPFKHAPEFRERKRLHESRNVEHSNRSGVSARNSLLSSKFGFRSKSLIQSSAGKYAPGFGIGALEELDFEDEDIYTSGLEIEETEVEDDEPSKIIKGNKRDKEQRQNGFLSGFKLAASSDYNVERFHPPVIPTDFELVHKFPFPLESRDKIVEPPPPEAPPPEDNNLKVLMDGFATLVARCGKLFEDLSKEKNRTNPLFSFLNGGIGYNYYARKLWEEKQKRIDQQKPVDMKSFSFAEKMTAESRGRILGEKPLERTSNESSSSVTYKGAIHLQSNLSDTFTKSASHIGLSESVKPFKNDPAKQERFELFLKDKYQGGLRSTNLEGTSNMTDADRAREKLDFEAAAEAIEKGEWNNMPDLSSARGMGEMNFVSSSDLEQHKIRQDEEKISTIYPKREEFQWRPSPILCKRFDIIDPFMGKPAPLPRARSKMDTLIFMPDVNKMKPEKTDNSLLLSGMELKETEKQLAENEPIIEPTAVSVQRPVDLYKAIFSDDSDDEGGNASLNQEDDLVKKTEGANMALNRLIAGDFLESLGKELGLEVPPDAPYRGDKTNSSNLLMGGLKNSLPKDKSTSTIQTSNKFLENKVTANKLSSPENSKDFASSSQVSEDKDKEGVPLVGDGPNHTFSSTRNTGSSACSEVAEIQEQKAEHRANKHRIHSRRHRSSSSCSDADSSSDEKETKGNAERTEHRASRHRTHSRHRRSPDMDSSSDHGRHYVSKSKNKKKPSRGKSENHSRHHSDKRKRSPSRYSRH